MLSRSSLRNKPLHPVIIALLCHTDLLNYILVVKKSRLQAALRLGSFIMVHVWRKLFCSDRILLQYYFESLECNRISQLQGFLMDFLFLRNDFTSKCSRTVLLCLHLKLINVFIGNVWVHRTHASIRLSYLEKINKIEVILLTSNLMEAMYEPADITILLNLKSFKVELQFKLQFKVPFAVDTKQVEYVIFGCCQRKGHQNN